MSAPSNGGRLDTVELVGLRGRGHHGVLAAERELGQDFVVDLVMHVDTRPAGASDDLADAVDYAGVARAVHGVVTGEPVDLLEALAARIADAVLADRRVRAVDVAVHKPQAPVPVPVADVVVRLHRASPATRAVLALGANLGDRAAALASAVAALSAVEGVTVLAASPVYETAPVVRDRAGQAGHPDYLNAVVVVATTLPPAALLAACHAVEAAHGRDRAAEAGRDAPRLLDVDVLCVGGVRTAARRPDDADDADDAGTHDSDAPAAGADGPVLPHPRAHERAFVLVPWAAVAPDDVLPGHGRVADLAAATGASGVRPTGAPLLRARGGGAA